MPELSEREVTDFFVSVSTELESSQAENTAAIQRGVTK